MKVIMPLHPRTRKCLGNSKLYDPINMIKPVSYLDMLLLEKNSRMILTDSGGVQKEAYFFKVPCITLREETEWIETVKSGWNVLAGSDKSKIIEALQRPVPTSIQKNMFVGESASKKILRVFDNIMRDEHGEQ